MLTGFRFCILLKSKCAEDVIKAYIDHICCRFGPSRKILTDNGTEFKNKLWTEVFDKLKTEQKFTPIYSPQCNGRIEGFHKFLKATIAKQLETRVKWDCLLLLGLIVPVATITSSPPNRVTFTQKYLNRSQKLR